MLGFAYPGVNSEVEPPRERITSPEQSAKRTAPCLPVPEFVRDRLLRSEGIALTEKETQKQRIKLNFCSFAASSWAVVYIDIKKPVKKAAQAAFSDEG